MLSKIHTKYGYKVIMPGDKTRHYFEALRYLVLAKAADSPNSL